MASRIVANDTLRCCQLLNFTMGFQGGNEVKENFPIPSNTIVLDTQKSVNQGIPFLDLSPVLTHPAWLV